MNNLNEDKTKLENSQEFLDFKKQYPKAYFYAAFTLYEDIKNAIWQFNYYDLESTKTTAFEVDKEIKIVSQSKIFQKEKVDPKEVNLDEVKIDIEKAFSIIDELKEKKYKGQTENKFIITLQNINNKLVWNITYLTTELNFLNVKIDANDGKIIEEKYESILNLKAK
ncbi:MAG: PepSY domain-containing protein [Candidatus Nanoarchaeia archaeon]|jgi:hypothetical protein|nr:PepSY domain-containing protein [Candidatus Nanoarchaeia archaeon]|tara:strand:+ start:10571 stop:11071 length:501 start_codon:yes stop_codon:yes gene_type:complete